MEPYGFIALGAALLFLILYWYKKVPKAVEPAQVDARIAEREQRVLKLYQNLEDLMDSFETYVEEEKVRFAEQAVAARGLVPPEVSDPSERGEARSVLPPAPPAIAEPEVIVETRSRAAFSRETTYRPEIVSVRAPRPGGGKPSDVPRPSGKLSPKAERIMRLYQSGKEPEIIAQEMGVALSEVTLVLGVYMRSAAHGG